MAEDDLPQALERRSGARAVQLVWLVPIVAALVGGWIAIKAAWDQGPTIQIRFQSGEGIEAGKTKIKHKSVDIGTVRGVALSQDRKTVVVTAEIDRHVSRAFLAEDTRYWVVRPRIAGGQISGLGTLLAGSFIGADPGRATTTRRDFEGLETPPPITSDIPGRQFMLGADALGSLDIGSPVYYRGMVAGRVVSTEIRPDGKTVGVGVFVHAPFDRFVTADTRFWNASGVDLKLDAAGVALQTQSLVTLLVGGIAFETPDAGDAPAPPAPAEAQFRLWENRGEALRARETVIEHYAMQFDQSVRGLSIGAPVDFRGIVVGEVRGIGLAFDREGRRFRTLVEIQFWPERLRSRDRGTKQAPADSRPGERMTRFVRNGLRGQLRTANLITGQLYVALDFFPKAPKAALDVKAFPAEIPTVSGGLSELQEAVGDIVQKLQKVPFDEIGQDLRRALAQLHATLERADGLLGQLSTEVAPEIKAALEQARKTLGSAEKVLASDSPMSGDLSETLHEVTRAAESVRALADYLERHPEALIRGKRGGDDRP